jgi:septal ring-binding cell division protein DamX
MEESSFKNHWVKFISLIGLCAIAVLLWHHKKADTTLMPMPVTAEVRSPITTMAPLHTTSFSLAAHNATIAAAIPKPSAIKPLEKCYSLQLMASTHRALLTEFVEKNRLKLSATIVPTQHEGRTWYIVAYGKFHTAHEAHFAKLHLPSSLQKLHPWIRVSAD